MSRETRLNLPINKADLTKTAVGLGNVDNTADAAKNVLSATKLATARTIDGVSFDGTANITTPSGVIVFMPAPSGDTTGVTDTANLVAAQAQLQSGIAGSIIFAAGIYWFTKDRVISAYQHWFGQGKDVTVLKLATAQHGNLLTTKNFNTWRVTDGSTAVSASESGTVTSGSATITAMADTSDINIGDTVRCNGFAIGSWVTAKTSSTVTLNVTATSSSGTQTASFSSIPVGWGLHDLTLDGYGRFTSQNNDNRIDPPSAPTVTATGTTGSTKYTYCVTAVNAIGETEGSVRTAITNGNATLTGSNYNALSWSAVAGATGYRIYRSKAYKLRSGATEDSILLGEGYIGVTGGSTTFNDTGASSELDWVPVQNNTGGRVLGSYSWGFTLDNVTIAGGACQGWDSLSPSTNAAATFYTNREFLPKISNLTVRDNRTGGWNLSGPTDGVCNGVELAHNGSFPGTTNRMANLDLQSSGWQITGYHLYGGGTQAGVRITGRANCFRNGQNEEGWTCWVIHGNLNDIDARTYTTSTSDDVAAFYLNAIGNKVNSLIEETGAGIIEFGPGAGTNNVHLYGFFAGNTIPTPWTGYMDSETEFYLRVIDNATNFASILFDQASHQVDARTGTSETLEAYNSGTITLNNGSAITLTVPTNATVRFPIGHTLKIVQLGAGQVTVAAAGGVTVNGTPGLKLRAQYSVATLVKRDTNTWVLGGDLSA